MFQKNLSNIRIESKPKELLSIFIKYYEIKIKETSKINVLNFNKILENKNAYNENDKNEVNNNYSKSLKINIDKTLEFLLIDNISEEDNNSKLNKLLGKISTKKESLIDKYYSNTSKGWKQILKEYEKINSKKQENNLKIFYPKEKELINNIIKNFEDSLKSLEEYLLKLEKTNDGIIMEELINQFFHEYSRISKKELSFDKDYYMNLCESGEGRYLLIFFQIQFMKYQVLNSYSKSFAKILENNYDLNKNNIIQEYTKLKDELKKMIDEIKKKNNIKSPKKLFKEWKFYRCISLKEDFMSFINKIKNYVDTIELKFSNDIINDRTNFLWLIKNNLDKFLD